MTATGGSGGVAGTMATGTGGTAGTTGTAGAAGAAGMMGLCPADPGTTMCGTAACPMVPASLSAICVQTCCTATSECGTKNAAMAAECAAPVGNTTMCPNEMIMGNMVSGCCMPNSNECGIVNIIGDMSCVPRTSPVLAIFGAMLEAKNCDGTPVMMMGTGGMGMNGTGGMGMNGTGGMGTGGM